MKRWNLPPPGDRSKRIDSVPGVEVNRDAPLSHRLLVDFRGRLPVGFSPMRDLPQYQPIVTAEGARASR